MTDKVPSYIQKLAITEEVIGKSMSKLLEDFNIFLEEDKALKLLYSIIAHFMYRLDTNPGNYFKLKFIDIVAEKDSFLAIKRSSDYTEDMITPQMFYERFCGTQMLKEELATSVDLFAKAFLGVAEEKQKTKNNVDRLIAYRKKLVIEIDKYKANSKNSKKVKERVIKQRKLDEKSLRSEFKKKEKAGNCSTLDMHHRARYIEQRKQLEQELRALWKENPEKFPF